MIKETGIEIVTTLEDVKEFIKMKIAQKEEEERNEILEEIMEILNEK